MKLLMNVKQFLDRIGQIQLINIDYTDINGFTFDILNVEFNYRQFNLFTIWITDTNWLVTICNVTLTNYKDND